MMECTDKSILIIEPFYGGSHEFLIRVLKTDQDIAKRCVVFSLPAKKWQWRARTSAIYFSEAIPFGNYKILFASSVLNLAELIALRPDLASIKKIIYFHENQLVYPVRQHQDRDFQFGYNQILTCLVADKVIFNSFFNMESFLTSISSHLKLIPDNRPKNIHDKIHPKCQVLYFPLLLHDECQLPDKKMKFHDEAINFAVALPDLNENNCADTIFHCLQMEKSNLSSNIQNCDGVNKNTDFEGIEVSKSLQKESVSKSMQDVLHKTRRSHTERYDSSVDLVIPTELELKDTAQCLHIVWPHRWEHDKDPETFFNIVLQLQAEGYKFCVSVVGETFTEVPEIFQRVRPLLKDKIVAWGYQSRSDFLKILDAAHVVVSTALHEFFGVSILEAVSRGCYPLCPKRLVYPEIYPEECLYSTQNQLLKRLKFFCQKPGCVKFKHCDDFIKKFSWTTLRDSYRNLLLG